MRNLLHLMRSDSKAGAQLEELIKKRNLCVSGVTLTELLQGKKLEEEFNAILESFIVLPFLDTTIDTWIRAGRISYALRRKGITMPTTDVLIASLAIEYEFIPSSMSFILSTDYSEPTTDDLHLVIYILSSVLLPLRLCHPSLPAV
jgi:predicted nucleic acid-binding protein